MFTASRSFSKFFLCCLLSITFVGQAASQTEEERTVIVLFGDSISVGFGEVVRVRNWNGQAFAGTPSQELTNLMNDSSRPSVVPNRGIGGSPTGREANGGSGDIAGADRVGRDLSASKQEFPGQQFITLILYGTNDFNFGISASDTSFNMKRIIRGARSEGYTPVVATLLRRDDRSVTLYNNGIKQAAAGESATLIDMFTLFNRAGGRSLLFDGVHPTENGYRIIAKLWFDHYLESAVIPQPGMPVIMPVLQLLLLDD